MALPWTADSAVTADSGIYTADGFGPVNPVLLMYRSYVYYFFWR